MYQTGYYATGYYATGYYGRTPTGVVPIQYTYEDLILQARVLLTDRNPACYRYSDEVLVEVLNRGMNELNRIRPDAFYNLYGQFGDGVPEVTLTLIPGTGEVYWTDDFHPEPKFFPALIYYVVGTTGIMEDANIESQSAAAFLRFFKNLVLHT